MNSKKKTAYNIHWFRRDLRLRDNTALFHALSGDKPVLPIFIFDSNILDTLENKTHPGVHFLYQIICDLNEELLKIGSKLHVYYGKPKDILKKLITDNNIDNVFCNEDYEPKAIQRDNEILNLLNANKVNFHKYKDHVLFAGKEILKTDGSPYVVFTAYKNKWLNTLSEKHYKPFKSLDLIGNLGKIDAPPIPSLKKLGFNETNIHFPEKKIHTEILKKYAKNRNFPYFKSTTRLGPHLRFGTLSIRKAVEVAHKLSDVWLSELIWRDFFIQILCNFPDVANCSFKKQYDKIKWRRDATEFNAWTQGQTGYPIVDAGMRELVSTGFMHNRVRMITASFLTKHLLIDWRKGERFFREYLLDYDFAINNGNWQWAAGTGADAAPYFRIFNPLTQQKKFDPDFEYIKKWVPEYGTEKYVLPIVDHHEARIRTILAYKKGLLKSI